MPEEKELIGITVKKNEDFSEWYNQVCLKAKLADFTAVKGFMAILPNAYEIWEKIQEYFNAKIKALGHRNAYFPAVIPESFLTKEKEHVEGFTPEVFWITHGGDEKLEERLALRPTSETIIMDSYSKIVKSWRDLPVLFNVWANVFRHETKMTKLFLRTREFLWQEGHTVHRTKEDADKETLLILDIYAKMCEELLAIPTIKGYKSDKEKFAGALYTTTLEAMMPDGRALQMGTSHNLGQNFAMAFGIKFMDKDESEKYAWTTSWGFSTRLIGALVMAHGDDKGLVLPPKVAPIQIVIIPILFEQTKGKVLKATQTVEKRLSKSFRVKHDFREEYTAGWKFNEWELCGVPLRIEIGPKDVEKNQVVLVRRDNGKKEIVKMKELENIVPKILDKIQKEMLAVAGKFLKENISTASCYADFRKIMEEKRSFVKTGWCGGRDCEDKIQEETTATIRAIPFEQPKNAGNCIKCGNKAKFLVYFAKSY